MGMLNESSAPVINHLLTGHFNEGADYHTQRSRGTADDLLIYTVGGAGRFGFAGGDHATEPGELTLLRTGTPHHYETQAEIGHWELLWAHFRPRTHWLDWLLAWPQIAPGVQSLVVPKPQRARLESALRSMHALATSGQPDREQWAMNALERVWLECLPLIQRNVYDERVARAVSLIRARLNEPLLLSDLAEDCHLSVSRLTHLFTAQVGQSPLAFLETERMRRAEQLLLLTSLTVSRIAQSLGYEDALYFSKRFRLRLGRSPRQYRADALEGMGAWVGES